MSRRRILAGPAAHAALLRGMDRMAGLLRPTLGPLPRTVVIGRLTSLSEGPEVLDSGATIARRTLQLADPFDDMGGMIMRHLVWQVYERTGDGTATAAVLAQALMRAGVRCVAAGVSPTSLQSGIRLGLDAAMSELRRQSRRVDSPADIGRVVRTLLPEPELAEMIGEVVDSVGPDGAILVEDSQGITTSHEYIDGLRWNAGFVSTFLLRADEVTTARLLNPCIFVTDHALERGEQLVPMLETCLAAGERNLFIVAPEISDNALGLLIANRDRGVLDGVIAVKAPSFGVQRTRILEDIATMTGGRCVVQERQDRLEDVTREHLGHARQAWATQLAFGILGGAGDKTGIRQRIGEVKTELKQSTSEDEYTTKLIRERIGKLAGITAVVRVGAASRAAQEDLKLRIEAAVKSARSAANDGVVPGGGKALLNCARSVDDLPIGGEIGFGARALGRALTEPMRAILSNAGVEPAAVVEHARCTNQVYDVLGQRWVDAWDGGIVDPLPVTQTVLETSVSAVVTALTADVLIHRKDAPTSVKP